MVSLYARHSCMFYGGKQAAGTILFIIITTGRLVKIVVGVVYAIHIKFIEMEGHKPSLRDTALVRKASIYTFELIPRLTLDCRYYSPETVLSQSNRISNELFWFT